MKIRAGLILICLSIIYFAKNMSLGKLLDLNEIRLLSALLWLALSFWIWRLPRPRVAGRLRLQGFLRLLSVLCGALFLITIAAAGFIEGFGKSPYAFTSWAILTNLFFMASAILGMELARAYLLNGLALRNPHLLIVLVSMIFLLLDLSLSKLSTLDTLQQAVNFSGTTLLPGISNNLLISYLAHLGGPAPAILYRITVEGFQLFSPRLPDLGWVCQALLGSIVPLACLILTQYLYHDAVRKRGDSPSKEESYGQWLVVSALAILIIWFAAGLFPIYPSVIATGSMEPLIKPGDVTILRKVQDEDLKEGDVIHFRKDNYFITHRVVEVLNSQTYKTKGDNNEVIDMDSVAVQQIKGKLLYVIPKAGWPSLWLRAQGLPRTGGGEDI